jgi:hypothetical protein
MQITISEASKAWGVARVTIYKKINQGKLSQLGNKKIDVAEMVRVFGEKKTKVNVQENVSTHNHLQSVQDAFLLEKIKILEENLRQANERERQAKDRENWLQDQVGKLSDTVKLLQAPPKEEASHKKRGLFSRLFGE